MKKSIQVILFSLIGSVQLFCQATSEINIQPDSLNKRERLLMDFNWRFALGHACNTEKDFTHATGYFSYFAKTGFGDGPAAAQFDDRAWRRLDLPHDWAVEQGFDKRASHSHGYKTVGPGFPETSIGWYRKSFFIPESDLGKRIKIEFDGVHRNSIVWVNGFYLGHEPSGYSSFWYDITDYLNYGGENMVAVRVDVTMEEGWYYEGAGIYRHVWLNKMSPLHIDHYGTFISSEVKEYIAELTARVTVMNETTKNTSFNIIQTVIDDKGNAVAIDELKNLSLNAGDSREFTSMIEVEDPVLWSLENPYLYKVLTVIKSGDTVIDTYETIIGIRTIRFDADEGFFLNGKHVKLKGTNNHQDHAGVGTAIPDALQEFRIRKLKEMGSNAYRCSHNPATPELLDACDKLGMLVIDENRLMAVTPEPLSQLERMILRDRNHPSVIIWSLGNEEWAIEGNEKGERITSTMQAYAKCLDPTRRITAASSGGWGYGTSAVLDVMGFNYLSHGNIDEHHANFPDQPAIGTEETTTQGTRGIYVDNRAIAHIAPTSRTPGGANIETGWKFYDERPFLTGLFYWTGFDYRGESNPFDFPAVSSQYGIIDLCGFPKDPFYYLKAWWTDEPVLHITPHWNWEGMEDEKIMVWAQSNCDEVDLFLNKKSLGRKTMEKNSHLEWEVSYKPGTLTSIGYKAGKEIITYKVETTGNPKAVELIPDRSVIRADGEDVSVITIQIVDSKGRVIPTAEDEIEFHIEGPGKIIGVGNGDPSSHEADKFFETIKKIKPGNFRKLSIDSTENRPEVAYDFDDSDWGDAFIEGRNYDYQDSAKAIVMRGTFTIEEINDVMKVTLFSKSLAIDQSLYINGHLMAENIAREAPDQEYAIDPFILKEGKNIYAVVGAPLVRRTQWEDLNTDPGIIQVIIPADNYRRKVFSGLAQLIVQSEKQPGTIVLRATSPNLSETEVQIVTEKFMLRPAVP